jgi:hypothetical protein
MYSSFLNSSLNMVGKCRRFSTYSYIIVSNHSAIVGIMMLKIQVFCQVKQPSSSTFSFSRIIKAASIKKKSFLNVIFKFNIYSFSFGFHIKSEIKQLSSDCSKQSYTEFEKPYRIIVRLFKF